jgi:hypothetical protein
VTAPDREGAAVEALCVLFHEAYEAAATEAGWETQERSRKPWAEVPEANKATMRAACCAVIAAWWVPESEVRERVAAAKALREAAEELEDTAAAECGGCDSCDGSRSLGMFATASWLRARAERIGEGE